MLLQSALSVYLTPCTLPTEMHMLWELCAVAFDLATWLVATLRPALPQFLLSTTHDFPIIRYSTGILRRSLDRRRGVLSFRGWTRRNDSWR